MANEFIARKGFIALESSQITGSLFVSGTSFFTGSIDILGGIENTQFIDFDIIATPAFQEGRISWIDDTKTLAIDTELNNFAIEVGHQNVVRVRNETGITISKGRAVYLSGSSGNRPLIYTSSYELDPTSAGTVGLVAADIGNANTGYVISNGLIRDINTQNFLAGAVLYLSSSGQLSTTAPVAPLHAVRMGKVITSAVAGIIHIDVDNGYEIGELHDVVDTSTSSTYGDLLVKSGSVWKSGRQLTGSYGLTGSLTATTFVGSLTGTSSWSTNAISSSLAVQNLVTASVSLNTITFTKGDGTTFPIVVNTGSGGGGGSVTINNNTDNYVITATGTANTLNGEAALTFDGTTLSTTDVSATGITGDVVIGTTSVTSGDLLASQILIQDDVTGVAGEYTIGSQIAYSWGDPGNNSLLTGRAGQVVYLSGSGNWKVARANTTGSSTSILGIVTSAEDQRNILLQGAVTLGTNLNSLIAGQPVYLSPLVDGEVTLTPPSSSGHIVRLLGWTIPGSGNDNIYFSPDNSYIVRT
jgi:hypothetical protein